MYIIEINHDVTTQFHSLWSTLVRMTPSHFNETIDWSELMSALMRSQGGHPATEFRAALALAHEAIQIWDLHGHLMLANPASEKIFGHGQQAGIHHEQLFGQFLHENGQSFLLDELPVRRLLEHLGPVEDQLMITHKEDERAHWLKVNGHSILDAEGADLGVVVTATDITDFVEHTQRLEHLASYDTLTQLPNRLLLAERIKMSLARGRRRHEMVAVCMLDLDGFKSTNDNLGHNAGDQLLREVATRVQESVRGDDTVARVGGDEFALLLCGIHKITECEQTLMRIIDRVGQPYQIAGHMTHVGVSAGISIYPWDGSDPDVLLAHADKALYQAKAAGKNRFHYFDRKLDMRLQANRSLMLRISEALGNDQFCLYYQPIVNCSRGSVEGLEALIRWRHPVLGLRTPSEFLPLIEQDELGITVGEWVVQEALKQLDRLHTSGSEIYISVNIAARHLLQPDFDRWLADEIARHGSHALTHFRIEIAEASAIADVNATAVALQRCSKRGIRVTLDNFGVGYASLQHLKRLTTDTLKIDQRIIQHMLAAPEELAMVGGIIGFADPFGNHVIAEGAETIDHLITLLELGCHVIQGYSIARPLPADQLDGWLRAFQPDPLWRLASKHRPSRDHFELLLAEANHRAWISRSIALYRDNQDHQAWQHEEKCPLDICLGKLKGPRSGHHDEFREILRLHEKIHARARQIGIDYQKGNPEAAREQEDKLFSEQEHLQSLLRNLRRKLRS